MPITDTSFTGINKARREKELAELMKRVEQKNSPLLRRGVGGEVLAVVILAAGLGKRMKNPDKAKVMFELRGKPLISYVVETALELNPQKIILIVGHQRESVTDYLKKKYDFHFEFAVQEPQLGTGHAVMQTGNLLRNFEGNVLILSGDVPLLTYQTAVRLLDEHTNKSFDATLLTAFFNNPGGYGRIIRNAGGTFLKIVEDKDTAEEQKKIKEINPAIYVVKSDILFNALTKINPENKQSEYYLTDIFNFIPNEKVGTVTAENENEVKGINSIEQLHEMEKAGFPLQRG